jgi:hypothetical protein
MGMQHDASIKPVCGRLRVRHHKKRSTFTAAGRHQGIKHLLGRQRIEVSSGLIGKDDLWPMGQCPGDRHALLFAARQEAGQGRCPCGKTKTAKPQVGCLRGVVG